jgi:hypothetical protein
MQKTQFSAAVVLCWLLSAFVAVALTPSNIVGEVDTASYTYFHTNLFVHTGEDRALGASEHDVARDYILSCFTNMGLSAELDPFTYSSYTNCNNVIAVKPGLNPSNFGCYIVGAHYDSVGIDRPGADDNASGVAGMLELARVLSEYTFRATLIFIAFDAEELGMRGSSHYVADSTSSTNGDPVKIYRGDIRGMISMDMIAYNPAGVNSNKAQIYGASSVTTMPVRTNLVQALMQYTDLAVQNSGGANNSDHGPFYYSGTYGDGGTGRIDSCLFIEYNHGSNPHYHQAADSVDTPGYIDYEFAAKMTKAVAGYLCSQAGLVPPASVSDPQLQASGTNLVVTWDSMAGLVQQVEYRDILTGPGEWTALGTFTNVDGAWALTVTDQIEGVDHRYYRVQSW